MTDKIDEIAIKIEVHGGLLVINTMAFYRGALVVERTTYDGFELADEVREAMMLLYKLVEKGK